MTFDPNTMLNVEALNAVRRLSPLLIEHASALMERMARAFDDHVIIEFYRSKNAQTLFDAIVQHKHLVALYETLIDIHFDAMAEQLEPFIHVTMVKKKVDKHLVTCINCGRNNIDPDTMLRLKSLRRDDSLHGFGSKEHEKYMQHSICELIELLAPYWTQLFPVLIGLFDISANDVNVIVNKQSIEDKIISFVFHKIGYTRSNLDVWYKVLRIFDVKQIPPSF